jgi:anaerobic ribonucleoside-triphosphate reductase
MPRDASSPSPFPPTTSPPTSTTTTLALNPCGGPPRATRLPYFANFVNSALSPEDARSMCCRLRLDTRELRHRGGGLFGANPLTGSIGVVTLNLPRLGHLSTSREDFLARMDQLLEVSRDSHLSERSSGKRSNWQEALRWR